MNIRSLLKEKEMKKWTIKICLLLISGIFLTGCNRDNDTLNKISNKDVDVSRKVEVDMVQHYGKMVTIGDFPFEKIFRESQIDEKKSQFHVREGQKMQSKNVLVPLLFDNQGILLTPKRYNQIHEKLLKRSIILEQEEGEVTPENIGKIIEVKTDEYFTDLETFQKVTKLKQATLEYVNKVKDFRLFDPYVTSFEKTSQNILPRKNNINRMSNYGFLQDGNILYGRWSNRASHYTGHTAGIVGENRFPTNMLNTMRNTYIVEAGGGDYWWSQAFVTSLRMTSGNNKWNESTTYQRMSLWLPSLTNGQRAAIVNYQNNQVGDYYWFSFDRYEKYYTNRWYCSKLQWRAYINVTGIDIDKNGGRVVFPSDIANNPIMYSVCFGYKAHIAI